MEDGSETTIETESVAATIETGSNVGSGGPEIETSKTDHQEASSVNLTSESVSKHSTECDEPVINLDGTTGEYAETTNAFEEPADVVETTETKPEEEVVETTTEDKPEEEVVETASEDKPSVKIKTSNDETDQIQAPSVGDDEEINLDHVRKSIVDPDMSGTAENIFGQPRKELGPAIEISSSESSFEEEESESDVLSYFAELGIATDKEPINREQYEEQYRSLKETALKIRRKNGLLNKKITEYYRKRKLNRAFEENVMDMHESLMETYEEKIDDYNELKMKTAREREAVDNEMNDMMNLRDEQLTELEKSFAAMQAREKEIGHGLIDTTTGKAISDKVVERLLFRQAAKSEEIAKIRLAFIKRRDKVKEIDNKIKALETIGGTLHLMDFEQLRMENQTFSDKIEERDEELMRLRDRYSHAMQALAHIREKINIIEVQIENLHEKKVIEEWNVSKSREYLNQLKIQRDTNRAQRDKLKANSGILTYPKLLLDMEIGIKQIESLGAKLEHLKLMNHENKVRLANIRSTMERTEHVSGKRKPRKFRRKVLLKDSHRYYLNRPTLTYPVLPKIAFLKSRLSKIKIEEIK